MQLISKTEIIKLRDAMSVEELRKITNKTKEENGYVSYKAIFETMGYKHAFNDKFFVPNSTI